MTFIMTTFCEPQIQLIFAKPILFFVIRPVAIFGQLLLNAIRRVVRRGLSGGRRGRRRGRGRRPRRGHGPVKYRGKRHAKLRRSRRRGRTRIIVIHVDGVRSGCCCGGGVFRGCTGHAGLSTLLLLLLLLLVAFIGSLPAPQPLKFIRAVFPTVSLAFIIISALQGQVTRRMAERGVQVQRRPALFILRFDVRRHGAGALQVLAGPELLLFAGLVGIGGRRRRGHGDIFAPSAARSTPSNRRRWRTQQRMLLLPFLLLLLLLLHERERGMTEKVQ